jgi:hypothetical protein
VQGDCPDGQFASLNVISDCEKINEFGKALKDKGQFDAFQEINPAGESEILKIARSCLKGCCAGCVVPAGIFKTMQTAAGLTLPKDINICVKTF